MYSAQGIVTVALLAAVCAWFLPRRFRGRQAAETDKETRFEYPAIPACGSAEPRNTAPLPYRPFRWGKDFKHVMGVRPMRWEDWIQLDRDFMAFHKLKRQHGRGDRVVRTLPGFEAVAAEACSEIALFLSKRYPHIVRCTVDGEDGIVKHVEFIPTGETWDLTQTDPMVVAGLLQQDDIALLVEEPNGEYRFVAGSICLAGSWRLEDKIGKTLAGIHLSGGVPGFPGKFQGSMERYFQGLKVHKPVERNNYSFQLDGELPWSNASYGSENDFGEKPSTDAARAPIIENGEVYYRSERQTLRRLPRTGCILFTIRTYLLPVSELAAEPGVPGRLAEAVRSWPDDMKVYKAGIQEYAESLLRYLDERHDAQVKSGLFDPASQETRYPF